MLTLKSITALLLAAFFFVSSSTLPLAQTFRFFPHFSRPSDDKAPADGGIQTLRRVREASLHRAAEGDQTERKSCVGQRRQGACQAFHGKASVSLGQASNKAEEPDAPGLP